MSTADWTKRNTTINLLDEEDEGEDILAYVAPTAHG